MNHAHIQCMCPSIRVFASNKNRSNLLSYNKNPLNNFVFYCLLFIVIDDLFLKEGGQTLEWTY